LVEQFLEQGVMDGLSEWVPDKGTPQGAVISPLLAKGRPRLALRNHWPSNEPFLN